MYEITFQFENGAQEVKFSAAPGSTILEAAKSANVAIDAPCNGNGSCGKCRVKLVSGEVTGVQTGHISDEDYAAGWRLSCSTKPAGDITVLVPDIASAYQSRMKTADLSSGEEIAIFNQLQQDVQAAGVDFANDFVQAVLTLDEPTLDDTMPDTERLARFAQDAFDGCTEVRLTYHTVKKLAKTLREANFKVQITGTLTDGVLTIMDVSEKEDAPLYGCAIDIGTTTVTGVLMDLKTGTLTAKASAGNEAAAGRDFKGNAAAARRGNVQIGGHSRLARVPRVHRVEHDDEPSASGRGREPRAHGAVYPDVFPVARHDGQGSWLPGQPGRGNPAGPEHRLVCRRRYHRRRVHEPHLGQG